jgi:hypothetical protein
MSDTTQPVILVKVKKHKNAIDMVLNVFMFVRMGDD